jgi:hypothetical protein
MLSTLTLIWNARCNRCSSLVSAGWLAVGIPASAVAPFAAR